MGERLEDDRLLRGDARFVADLRLPGTVDVAFVRSDEAHAEVRAVDVSAARLVDGVLDVVTAGDMDGVEPVPHFAQRIRDVRAFPLARGRVRYVGTPIAAVVALDRYAAEDGAEAVVVDLEPLPAAITVDQALSPTAPRLYQDWPDNRAIEGTVVDDVSIGEVFGRLRTVRDTFVFGRQGAVPVETRGVVAQWSDGRLTVWTSTQIPQIARTALSRVLGLPERAVRVVVPDVGGGFGAKAEIYPEEYVVAWLAMRLHRPVRWIEDRYEHLTATCQARDVRIDLEAAVAEDGTIEALRGTVIHDLGSAQVYPNGSMPAFIAAAGLPGAYRIPRQRVHVVGVVTNKTPSGAYRGFGGPEAVFAMERMMDKVAREVGVDRMELRRRMLVDPGELPYRTASGARIDSGSHRACFDRAVRLAEGAAAAARSRLDPDGSERIGLGIATFVDSGAPSFYGTTGNWTSHDHCEIRFDADGGATVTVGVSAFGQGLQTMAATVAARELGLPVDHVRVVMGDTDAAPFGIGSWGSRSTIVASGAIKAAAAGVLDKARRIAAHLLEAAPEDVEVGDGRFSVRGSPGVGVTWAQVAHAALQAAVFLPPGLAPGLDASATYAPPNVELIRSTSGKTNAAASFANATHAAVVSVDVETGKVRVLEFIAVHDCGCIINRHIVAGQIHGGVAQGIGGTLLEQFLYDEHGTPMATTFVEYLLPAAGDLPTIREETIETPAPEMPFGVKGIGEAGIVGPAPAVVSAIEDALGPIVGRGVPGLNALPVTPAMVVAVLRKAPAAGVR